MLSFVIGITAGILCTLSFLPQVIKAVKTEQTKDLSAITFFALSIGVFLWLIYGLMIGDMPIILANSATFILVSIIALMKIKHG